MIIILSIVVVVIVLVTGYAYYTVSGTTKGKQK